MNIKRLIEWINNQNRKPSNIAFTDGQERRLAYEIEIIFKKTCCKNCGRAIKLDFSCYDCSISKD